MNTATRAVCLCRSARMMLLLGLGALAGLAGVAQAQPFNINPLTACIVPSADYSYFRAYFGYENNELSDTVTITNSTLTPAVGTTPITLFFKGYEQYAFRAEFAPTETAPELTWSFDGKSVRASWTSPICGFELVPQTILLNPNPGPLTYSPTGSFQIPSPVSSAGLGISLSSLTPGVCTKAPLNFFNLLSAGTCTVAYDQAGGGYYAPAPQLTQDIIINKANQTALTATAGATTLNVGDTTNLGSAGGTGTGAVSFASNNPNCTIVGNTLTAAGSGTCIVTATKATDTNYLVATSAGLSITINASAQATLMVTAAATTLAFGDTTTLGSLGGSGTGAVSFASNNPNCTIVGSTLMAAAVGQCNVTATKAAETNFTAATSAPIVVSITPAPQTISFNPIASVLANTPPFALSATGGASGNAVMFTSLTTATCSNGGVNGAIVTLVNNATGICIIRAAQAGTANYAPAATVDRTIVIGNLPPPPPPSAPTNLACVVTVDRSIDCQFAVATTTTANPIQSYRLYCASTAGVAVQTTVDANMTRATIPNAAAGRYTCSVHAQALRSTSEASNTASVVVNITSMALRNQIDIDGTGFANILLRGLGSANSANTATDALTKTNIVSLLGRFDGSKFNFTPIADTGVSLNIQGVGDVQGRNTTSLISRNAADDVRVDLTLPVNDAAAITLRRARADWALDAVTDLDGDGRADMVWRYMKPGSNDSGVIFAWYMDSLPTLRVAEVKHRGGAPLDWSLIGGADLNGDGKGDLVWLSATNEIRSLTAKANRTWTNERIGQLPNGYRIIKLGDFNADGRGDILFKDATGRVKLWLMNGINIARDVTLPAIDSTWIFYAAGDFDGDGTMDVVWKKPDDVLVLWLNHEAMITLPTILENVGKAPAGGVPVE